MLLRSNSFQVSLLLSDLNQLRGANLRQGYVVLFSLESGVPTLDFLWLIFLYYFGQSLINGLLHTGNEVPKIIFWLLLLAGGLKGRWVCPFQDPALEDISCI